eukprot:268268-Rhodomonas_salina.6
MDATNKCMVPGWDEYNDFMTQFRKCKVLRVHGVGFIPTSPNLTFSQIHGITMLLEKPEVLHGSLISFEFDALFLEDNGDMALHDFVIELRKELPHWDAWYEYKFTQTMGETVRFVFWRVGHMKDKAVTRLFAHGNALITSVDNTEFKQETHVIFNGTKAQYLHAEATQFIVSLPGIDRIQNNNVKALTLMIPNSPVLSFKEAKRQKKLISSDIAVVWWFDIVNLVQNMPHCCKLTITGPFSTDHTAEEVTKKINKLLDSIPNESRLSEIYIELEDPMGSQHPQHVYTSKEKVQWRQGALQSSGGVLLMYSHRNEYRPPPLLGKRKKKISHRKETR